MTSCTIEWPEGGLISADKAFIWYAFTLAFALPVILISIFYSLVVIRIRTSGPTNISAHKRQSSRKVTRMVLAVITVYVVCWLPYWVFQVSTEHPHHYHMKLCFVQFYDRAPSISFNTDQSCLRCFVFACYTLFFAHFTT